MDQIISYFKQGLLYAEILEILRLKHDIVISLSTLKRQLRDSGLKRRALQDVRSTEEEIQNAIQKELNGSGSNIGYRRLRASLTSKSIICCHEDVRRIVKSLDPQGVELRRKRRLHRRKYVSKGPNYAWHIDGHDKLKPFGFSIHGGIDGFSRRLIWLEVGPSHKLPEVVAKFYLDAVKKAGGIPTFLKADDGTEHSLIEPIHVYLRSLDDDTSSVKSFSIIASMENQRIESYWSTLQRDRIGWWKSFFQDMVDLNIFTNSDPVLVQCIRFCFMGVLRKELNSVRDEWNVHLISRSRNNGVRGRPNVMYELPHLFEAENCLVPVQIEEVDQFYPCVDTKIPDDVSTEFKEFAYYFMQEDGLTYPEDSAQGLELYTYLLSKIEQSS